MSADLTDRGYTQVGEFRGCPIWQDGNGDHWVEYTKDYRHEVTNAHCQPLVDIDGRAHADAERLPS